MRSADHPSKPKSGLPGDRVIGRSGDRLAREQCKVFPATEEAGS